MNKLKLIIALILLTFQSVIALSQCKCKLNTSPFKGADNKVSDVLKISPQNELVGQTDVGKVISIGPTIILQNLFQVYQGSYVKLVNNCPEGYTVFTKEELETLIKRPDFQTLIGKDYLNVVRPVLIYSSVKLYPENEDGADNRAYMYYVIRLDEQNNPTISTEETFFIEENLRKTICKRIPNSFTINLEGYEGYDLEDGKTYQFNVQNRNILKYYIETNDGRIFNKQAFNYAHKGNAWGCAYINFRVQLFNGAVQGDCISIWTLSKFRLNSNSDASVSQIKKVTIPNVKSNVSNGMFFAPGTAPVAPIIKDSNSAYVYYSEKDTNALKVLKLSNVGVQIGNPIDTKEVGEPFDIISSPFGFVVMAREKDKAWISAFNKNGNLRWKRTLHNNGFEPFKGTDQIEFAINDKCTLGAGMEAMYSPHNGRLIYARGRIIAIWSHINQFTLDPNGQRNDHNGDSMISLDADTGYNQKLYWAWSSSHSMYQTLHYDGKYLYAASLGDAFPQGIFFKVCDVDQNLECKGSVNLIPGFMPGNGAGNSSARQGSFIDILGKNNEKYFVYQRKACKGGWGDQLQTNDKNELVLIRLDSNLKLISSLVILSGDIASRVNALKSVRYGKNILIAYSIIPKKAVGNYNGNYIDQALDESYYILLNGSNGSVITGPTKFDSYQVNASDDWRILEDGRVVYTIVDKDNNLNFFYTPALQAINYPNPIKASDLVYGQKNFYNSKFEIKKNNYNDVCKLTGDPNFNLVNLINMNEDESILSGNLETTTSIRLYSTLLVLILSLFL